MMRILGIAILFVAGAWWEPAAGASTQPATQPSTQPGKELTLDLGNKATMKLVKIPAGKFPMGSPETEKDRDKGEVQHEVTISKPFYMGITHVTVDQFAAFVKDSKYTTQAEKDRSSGGFVIQEGRFHPSTNSWSWRKPSFEQKGDHPAVHMNWNDANAFCNWLSRKTGKTVVLPTEAQWEYACRAGTKTAYSWGEDPNAGKGWINCADQSLRKKLPYHPSVIWDDGFAFTSPVGSFKPNAFGLYDMGGNVSQWCKERPRPYGKEAVTDPTGPDAGVFRVLRGGSWECSPGRCRSASRSQLFVEGSNDMIGFRVTVLVGVD